jgi:hypothetical protein
MLALGPSIMVLLPDDKRSEILKRLLKVAILDPNEILDTNDGGYYLILDIVFALAAV